MGEWWWWTTGGKQRFWLGTSCKRHQIEGQFSASSSRLCCVSGCLLTEEGSSFMAFYLYPSVVIHSGGLPVRTAVWIRTCIWVALQKAAWHVTSGSLRRSEDGQISHKVFCCGMMFWANYFRGPTLFCSVSTPDSHWSFHHTHICPRAEKT